MRKKPSCSYQFGDFLLVIFHFGCGPSIIWSLCHFSNYSLRIDQWFAWMSVLYWKRQTKVPQRDWFYFTAKIINLTAAPTVQTSCCICNSESHCHRLRKLAAYVDVLGVVDHRQIQISEHELRLEEAETDNKIKSSGSRFNQIHLIWIMMVNKFWFKNVMKNFG